jgi:CRP/FNR family transcriptional regulator, cyclic AMP receptor protein
LSQDRLVPGSSWEQRSKTGRGKSANGSAREHSDVGVERLARARKRKTAFDPHVVFTGRGHGQVRKRFLAGQFSQGDPADAAFFVESGCIKESTIVRNGGEAVVALCGLGEFFGTRCLLDWPRMATATALIDSSVVRITSTALVRMLREVPDFAEMFATFMVQRSADDQERLISHLTHSAEQRLAYMLLRLAGSGRGDYALPIPIPISQSLFAKMIGTTRSRVSFFMNRFRQKGFIEYGLDGRIRVHRSLRSTVIEDWF